MKLLTIFSIMLACGSSDAANFTGTWNITDDESSVCDDGTTHTGTYPVTITFTKTSESNVLESPTGPWGGGFLIGCGPRQWSLDGDTLTLVGSPLPGCETPDIDGVAFMYAQFTATTSDGRNLRTSANGTLLDGAVTCTFEILGVATR